MHLLCCIAFKPTAAMVHLQTRGRTMAAGMEECSFRALLRNTSEIDWTLIPVGLADNTVFDCYGAIPPGVFGCF